METAGYADRSTWRQNSVCRANGAPMAEAVFWTTGARGSVATQGVEMGFKARSDEPGPISRCANDQGTTLSQTRTVLHRQQSSCPIRVNQGKKRGAIASPPQSYKTRA